MGGKFENRRRLELAQIRRVAGETTKAVVTGRSHLSYRDWEAEWERRLRRSFE